MPNLPAGSIGINAAEESIWTSFLKAHDIDAFALGLGTGVGQSALDPIAYDGHSGTNTGSIVVTDLGQLAATLMSTVGSASGNLLADGVIPGGFGADGGYVKSITVDGTTYTYNPAGSITASGVDHGSFDTTTHRETITLASGAVLTIDMDDGSFSYAA